jgi:acylphosphatase
MAQSFEQIPYFNSLLSLTYEHRLSLARSGCKSFRFLRNRTVLKARVKPVASVKITFGRVSEMVEGKLAKLFYVSGTVQGVGFRFFSQRVSARLGLAGYVKNLRDGRVEVYAIGAPSELAALRRELERGPRSSVVTNVFEEEAGIEEKYAHDFSIENDSW